MKKLGDWHLAVLIKKVAFRYLQMANPNATIGWQRICNTFDWDSWI